MSPLGIAIDALIKHLIHAGYWALADTIYAGKDIEVSLLEVLTRLKATKAKSPEEAHVLDAFMWRVREILEIVRLRT